VFTESGAGAGEVCGILPELVANMSTTASDAIRRSTGAFA
jgi:hypothetical protein